MAEKKKDPHGDWLKSAFNKLMGKGNPDGENAQTAVGEPKARRDGLVPGSPEAIAADKKAAEEAKKKKAK